MSGEQIVCCRCGAVIRNRRAFAQWHAKAHSDNPIEQERIIIDSLYGSDKVEQLIRDYQNGCTCVYEMLPIDISKYLRLLGIKRTSSEERQTERYKRKYLEAIQNKYGPEITNVSQVREVQEKKEKTYSKKYGSYEAYLSQCRGKMEKGYCEYKKDGERVSKTKDAATRTLHDRYGVDNPAQIESVRRRISMKARARMASMSREEKSAATHAARVAIPHHWAKTTKLEQIVIDGLERIGIGYKLHQRVGRYSIDIVVGRIAIEVNGDVYHANPRIYNGSDEVLNGAFASKVWERDARKRKVIEEAGYNLVVLWEDEIRANKNQIESFLKTKLSA